MQSTVIGVATPFDISALLELIDVPHHPAGQQSQLRAERLLTSAGFRGDGAQVVAAAPFGADMRGLLERNADITSKLVVALTKRLRETNERISRQSFQTVPSRVAGVLSQLVDSESAYAELHRRTEDGRWLTDIVRGRDGRLLLSSIGLDVAMAMLYDGVEIDERTPPG